MAILVNNRTQETCAAPGTGTVTLLGAVTGYRTFSAGIGANNLTYYTIADQTGSNWEVGIGTVGSGGTTLIRTTVLDSSNGGSLTNFSSGTQLVYSDYPANAAVLQTDVGTAPNQVPLNQYLGKMAYQDPAGVNITGGSASNLQNLTNIFAIQPTPSAINASATLTIAQLLTRIITVNSATAVAFTLPTGTLTDAGILNGLLLVNQSFDWNIVNIGSAVGIITVSGGTNNTLIGSGTIAIATSATFRTVKTATNTYNTYRVN